MPAQPWTCAGLYLTLVILIEEYGASGVGACKVEYERERDRANDGWTGRRSSNFRCWLFCVGRKTAVFDVQLEVLAHFVAVENLAARTAFFGQQRIETVNHP